LSLLLVFQTILMGSTIMQHFIPAKSGPHAYRPRHMATFWTPAASVIREIRNCMWHAARHRQPRVMIASGKTNVEFGPIREVWFEAALYFNYSELRLLKEKLNELVIIRTLAVSNIRMYKPWYCEEHCDLFRSCTLISAVVLRSENLPISLWDSW
jgi:hypothetical protein